MPMPMHVTWSSASTCCLSCSKEMLMTADTRIRVESPMEHSAKVGLVVRRRFSPTGICFLFMESSSAGHRRRRGMGAVHQALEHFDVGRLGVPESQQIAGESCLVGRIVAFTTPLQYATRFEKLLRDEGAEPLWCPTMVTQQTEQTRRAVEAHLVAFRSSESEVHGIAFTSRAGITAFADALNGRQIPWYSSHRLQDGKEGDEYHHTFIVAALGKDAELLQELKLIADSSRVTMFVPSIATPQALVEALGQGRGRKILCPVPLVEGLEEPPVVPQFLRELSKQGWDPVRVNSYATRWLGPDCAKALLVNHLTAKQAQFVAMDALVFTSTAEIEGLLKSLASLGCDGIQALQKGTRKFLVAAHGPVTALGAERLGVDVDVFGKEFQSFAGVIKALDAKFCEIAHARSQR